MTGSIDAFLSAWTTAERAGDTEKLATLLTDDFFGVGPLGFVLLRPAWLDRHRQGLTYEAFGLDEIQVRLHGGVAIVTARNITRGTFHGTPIPEAVRATLVIGTESRTQRLAAIHMSFIAGTTGSPLIPAAVNPAESTSQLERGSGKDHATEDGEGR
jgi:ketosteroid isomerase-like protein